jgi:16S rRNA (cytosine1402-N4)-methyltransferase
MHAPVLLQESIAGLNLGPDSIVLDATLGGCGHARAILQELGPEGMLIGIDRDEEALARAERELDASNDKRVHLRHANFAEMQAVLADIGCAAVDAVLMDLGISSFQLDAAERGFSFQRAGPLDMRMDSSRGMSAAEIVNSAEERDLADIFYRLGEERDARRIARAVVAERARSAIEDTARLAELISRVKGGRRGRIHPATKSFMALRMAVNDEIGSLEAGLAAALDALLPGGRLAVITFHSLEDRIVKNFMKEHVGRKISLQAGGERWQGTAPRVTLVNRKTITAGERELDENPRARSAKLRIAERC